MIYTVERVIDIWLDLFSYTYVASKETWSAIASPNNTPVFISSLVKYSLGPTLAFLWGRRAFKQEEKVRSGKEKAKDDEKSRAIKTMLKMEIDYNIKRIKQLAREYEMILIVPSEKRAKGTLYISPHGLQTQALDSLIDQIPRTLTIPEITELYEMYGDFRSIAYAYDVRQPKVIYDMGDVEIRLCSETLRQLKLFLDRRLANQIFKSWFRDDFFVAADTAFPRWMRRKSGSETQPGQ